ncbi:MAG: hypothetical protein U1E52_20695 [Geminicoccaceae bacterium]
MRSYLRLLSLSATVVMATLLAQTDAARAGGVAGQAGPNSDVPAVGSAVAPTTSLTTKSYTIGPKGSQGNLEGAVCPGVSRVISGACHPFYNPKVAIINQFPNLSLNTWRCGFKNNTTATVTVYIYTVCGS